MIWGRMTHKCVSKITIIGSDNGLSPGRRQAINITNAGILLIRPLETNCSEILIGIRSFPFKKMHLQMLSVKCRPFCLDRNLECGKRLCDAIIMLYLSIESIIRYCVMLFFSQELRTFPATRESQATSG